jgi:hypothetical protein
MIKSNVDIYGQVYPIVAQFPAQPVTCVTCITCVYLHVTDLRYVTS